VLITPDHADAGKGALSGGGRNFDAWLIIFCASVGGSQDEHCQRDDLVRRCDSRSTYSGPLFYLITSYRLHVLLSRAEVGDGDQIRTQNTQITLGTPLLPVCDCDSERGSCTARKKTIVTRLSLRA
jgi:hypothetical protein